jgi:hypothetical protein
MKMDSLYDRSADSRPKSCGRNSAGRYDVNSARNIYALGDAARETEVAVHFSGCNINHHHTDVTGTRDNLPEFTRRFHRDLSCSLHTLLCKRKYDTPRELFDDRPTHWVRLLDAPAQASRLIYDITNTVAAGLVARPEHMPMRTLDVGLWKTGYIAIARPPLYFDESRPEIVRLYLTPPPLLYEAFGGDLDALVFHMKRLENDAIRALRDAQKRPVMGAKNVTRIHPWSEPRTMREPGGNPVPTFRIGARGILGRTRRIEGACEARAFRRAHRETRIARRDGDPSRAYPYGTYAARVYQGAPVEDVSLDALVARPGPLLSNIEAELATQRVDRDVVRARVHHIGDEVRGAFAEEAAVIVEDSHLDLVLPERTPVARASGDDVEPGGREPAVVRHRFDKRRPETARRLIFLRDKRRGRPPGSDPPGE